MSATAISARDRRTRVPGWLRPLFGQRGLSTGATMLVALIVLSFVGPLFDTAGANTTTTTIMAGVSGAHPFGTDDVGRDILARVFAAIRLDLELAVMIGALATVAGTTIGLISGYAGGLVDLVIMRVVDVMMSIPVFILALITAIVLGSTEQTLVLALGFAYAPVAVRVIRSQALSLRQLPMIEASRAIGTPTWRIITWHILPNTYSVLTAQATLFLAWAILDTAAMSFIGVGVHQPTAELGAMVAEGSEYIISGQWWMSIFPGLFIAILVIAFNLIGDGLRDHLDPRSRR